MPEQTYDYLIAPKASFDATADAIREKTGSQASITWGQDGFAEAIDDLVNHIGDTMAAETVNIDINVTGTEVKPAAFYGNSSITKINAPLVTKVGDAAFYSCSGVTECYFPNLTTVGFRSFNKFGTAGMSLFLPKASTFTNGSFVENINSSTTVAFAGAHASYIVLPSLQGISTTYMYSGMKNLLGADLGSTTRLETYCFSSSSKLDTLILRITNGMVNLANVNAFNATPFASGGAGGHIYIAKTYYDKLGTGLSGDYKAATNWSTIDGYGTITWHAIEGSYYETHYADGTPISTT